MWLIGGAYKSRSSGGWRFSTKGIKPEIDNVIGRRKRSEERIGYKKGRGIGVEKKGIRGVMTMNYLVV